MARVARLEILLQGVGVRRGGRWVLNNIDLHLQPAQRCALIGENGAGKTQLLKLLAGDLWPTPTGREKLSYRIGGRPIERLDAKPRIAYLGAERQDKYARYAWNLSVRDLLATGLHGTDLLLRPVRSHERRKVDAMLRAAGLTTLASRDFLSLSYGQKRLALLARALIRRPDWLLLDEIYNGLDARHRRRIDALLAGARRRGSGWIAAAHRSIDVPQGTTRLIEISAGRLHGAAAPGGAHPAPPALRSAAAPQRLRAERSIPPRAGEVLLRLVDADLYVEYRPVLRGMNWELRAGEHWAVQGANGSGKSSFLKLLYGDLAPALGGRIERYAFPAGTAIEEWKRTVGYVSPELQADYAVDVTLADLVASGRYSSIGLFELATREDRHVAAQWLKFFELSAVAKRRPREVSYGQLRRALIARALASGPRILLLDEPLTGLDPGQRATIKRLLERLMQGRVTIVMAVHHADDLPRGVCKSLHLHKRRALASDTQTANSIGGRRH